MIDGQRQSRTEMLCISAMNHGSTRRSKPLDSRLWGFAPNPTRAPPLDPAKRRALGTRLVVSLARPAAPGHKAPMTSATLQRNAWWAALALIAATLLAPLLIVDVPPV